MDYNKSSFVFHSVLEGKKFSTQCCISVDLGGKMSDKDCGPSNEEEICKGFHGFSAMKNLSHLQCLTSVS